MLCCVFVFLNNNCLLQNLCEYLRMIVFFWGGGVIAEFIDEDKHVCVCVFSGNEVCLR